MSSPGSVTHWITQLLAGDDQAAHKLWERYYQQLVEMARKRLRRSPPGAVDEEDVVVNAFDSFCRDARRGRFPRLQDRQSLWLLLVTFTGQKAIDAIRRENAAKRRPPQHGDTEPALEQVLSREPSPELAAQLAEELEGLLNLLPSAESRQIAVWMLQPGWTNARIAVKLGCTERTVQRKVRQIQTLWQKTMENDR
jgi:RNA polymerase sigma factor (sigma-70 family)